MIGKVVKALLREWRNHIRLLAFREKWRENNPGNKTIAGTIFPLEAVHVGDHTYGTIYVHYYRQDRELNGLNGGAERQDKVCLTIGACCSIAQNVHFYLGGEHNYRTLSSYPFKNIITRNRIAESISRGPIVIGDDVWIGSEVIILSGTRIGQGAVIGAGSVVSGEIPPYAVYAGGRILRYRFPQKIRDKLAGFDFSRLDWERIEQDFDPFYTELTEENVDMILQKIPLRDR